MAFPSHSSPIAKSVTISFWDEGLAYFGVPPFAIAPFRTETYEGTIRKENNEFRGCRVDVMNVIAHCHGTHLETGAHVFPSIGTVKALFPMPFSISVLLMTVPAVSYKDTKETYSVPLEPNEQVITREHIQERMASYDLAKVEGLLFRVFQMPLKDQIHYYNTQKSPFFTREAMEWITTLKKRHLLVDLPSIDRGKDEGRLANHRHFFSHYPDGSIVEFCYLPPELPDGYYTCHYAFVPMDTDAVPVCLILTS